MENIYDGVEVLELLAPQSITDTNVNGTAVDISENVGKGIIVTHIAGVGEGESVTVDLKHGTTSQTATTLKERLHDAEDTDGVYGSKVIPDDLYAYGAVSVGVVGTAIVGVSLLAPKKYV